ncbi:hypothetical protein ALC57_07876 [Trachymyrmex cornetzi]|uniref:Uncharacterized protein n=1 Tax=Trachymyrmex cornetzi TaxID=471704 RepID=A0A195E3S8_9HYME|nr:hypothetical protein ALC57_07876 [Trachymyrmex cornetzi]
MPCRAFTACSLLRLRQHQRQQHPDAQWSMVPCRCPLYPLDIPRSVDLKPLRETAVAVPAPKITEKRKAEDADASKDLKKKLQLAEQARCLLFYVLSPDPDFRNCQGFLHRPFMTHHYFCRSICFPNRIVAPCTVLSRITE